MDNRNAAQSILDELFSEEQKKGLRKKYFAVQGRLVQFVEQDVQDARSLSAAEARTGKRIAWGYIEGFLVWKATDDGLYLLKSYAPGKKGGQ